MDGDVEEDAKKMVKKVEARTKEGQRWMAGFRQGMERTSELEKGRSRWEPLSFEQIFHHVFVMAAFCQVLSLHSSSHYINDTHST